MTGSYWLAALAVCMVGSGVRAEDAYSVKLSETATGDVIAVERTDTLNSVVKGVDAAGKTVVNDVTKSTVTYVYKETILERKTGERPTRLSRQYERAEKTEGGRTIPLPYQGKTVLIEKKGKEYDFRLDGGKELNTEDADLLEQEFNGHIVGDQTDLAKLFLPAKPVPLNEVWKADTDLMVKQLTQGNDIGVDPLKAKGTAVLTRTYKMGDKQYGVLHCEAEAPIESLGYGGANTKLEDGAKLSFQLDMDACIDGQGGAIKAINVIKMNGACSVLLPDGNDGKMTLSIECSATISRHKQVEK